MSYTCWCVVWSRSLELRYHDHRVESVLRSVFSCHVGMPCFTIKCQLEQGRVQVEKKHQNCVQLFARSAFVATTCMEPMQWINFSPQKDNIYECPCVLVRAISPTMYRLQRNGAKRRKTSNGITKCPTV